MAQAGGALATPILPSTTVNGFATSPVAKATVHNAASLDQLRLALKQLDSQHAEVTAKLDATLASRHDFSRQLAKVDLSRARLTKLSHATRALSQGGLADAAHTATRISSAVKRLDLEQSRVKATLAVVEQVAELKSCVLGVMGSMGAPQDWETAAEYISRASKIPSEVVNSGFAEQVVPTAEVPDPPATTLHQAAESLCQLFVREFEKAVEDGDGARVTRFFKMFPLIGRSEQGLAAYGRYVCTGVSSRARLNMQGAGKSNEGTFYVTALTRLFEHIAQVVDGHSNLVERHYGRGTMVKIMEKLHNEADVQGGIILDTWNDERTIDRRLTDVKSYAFTFLVQSFLNTPNRSSTPRPASPAPGRKMPAQESEDGIEMKEVDSILGEIAAMLGHWSLYQRFVSSRAAEDSTQDDDDQPLMMPPFLEHSNLPKKVNKHLTEPFGVLATFFLRRAIERAFQLDEAPTGLTLSLDKPLSANPPFITSAVDDVMYMVNQIIQRSLATSHGRLMMGVVATVGRVLGSDFIGMIQRKMRNESYPRAAISGAIPPEHKTLEFLVLINSLDVASDYLKRIVLQQLDAQRSLAELFPMSNEAAMVKQALSNLDVTFASKATELMNDGLTVTFTQVVKPRLRPLVADLFKDADYTTANDGVTAEGQYDGEEDDLPQPEALRARFQQGWDRAVKPVRRILTDRTAERLLSTSIVWLTGQLEKRIWAFRGRISEAGALRLERNVSDIANVAIRGEHFKLREHFARCFEIVTIMTMEEDEWDEVKDGHEVHEGRGWVLSTEERSQAREMLMT